MGRVTLIQSNFTAGEITPRCFGRVDVARYQDGAETVENARLLVHGGAERRWGLRYVAETKDSGTARSRLAPYIFSKTQAYIVEFGNLYARFYDTDGQIQDGLSPLELVTPWNVAQTLDFDYAQSADTMLLTHEDVAPYRLRRFTTTRWTLAAVPFYAEPYAEIGTYPAAALTLSSAAVGSRTFTAGAAAFLASDVGREISYQGGFGIITGYTSTTVVTVNVTEAFGGTAIPSGAWNLSSSPQTTCTPSAKDPVGTAITLTLAAAGWRTDDVGKHVNINAGLAKITSYVSATVVNATIVQEMSATVGAPALAWTLEQSVWGGVNGYPRTVTFREQRSWFAGSPGFPLGFWGSVIGENFNFTLGTLADDAVSFQIAADQYNPIQHLASVKALIVLTTGAEYTAHGGPELPIMPTNVQIKDQSDFGSSSVRPIRVGKELLTVQAGGQKIRALSADRYDSGQYDAPDLSALAEHITGDGVIDGAYLKVPDPIVLYPRTDGQIAALTIDRDQGVIAWSRYVTDGEFEAIAVIPITGGERVYVIVKRNIDGVDRRFIEYFDPDLNTDCAITGTSVGGSLVWGGLDHLEGKTVDVLADGVDMGTFEVVGGEITLPRLAYAVEIGLNYVMTVKTLTPEVPTPTGSAQGTQMSISEVVLRVLDSIGGKVNGKDIQFRNTGLDVLDQAPPSFTGLLSGHYFGWQKGIAQLTITQDRPYPFHLQAVIKTFTSDG